MRRKVELDAVLRRIRAQVDDAQGAFAENALPFLLTAIQVVPDLGRRAFVSEYLCAHKTARPEDPAAMSNSKFQLGPGRKWPPHECFGLSSSSPQPSRVRCGARQAQPDLQG